MRMFNFNGSDVISLSDGYPDEIDGIIHVSGHIHIGPFPKIGDQATSTGDSYKHVFEFIDEIERCSDPREMYFSTMQRVAVLNLDGTIEWEKPTLKWWARLWNDISTRLTPHT